MIVLRVALQRSAVAFAAPNGGTMTGSLLSSSGKQCLMSKVQTVFSRQSSQGVRQIKEALPKFKSLKERLMAPASDKAIVVGRGVLAGGSVLGIGALCYYGLGLSNQVGIIDKAALWPEIVRTRVRDTYMYFGGSLVVTAAAAVAVSRTPFLMNLVMRNSGVAFIGYLAALIGPIFLCIFTPYKEGFGTKQLTWLLFNATSGALLAPLALLGGPLLIQAACYTAGVVGGLSMVAVCAPSEKFLYIGGPLGMALGLVCIASHGAWLLPASTALGAGLYSVSLYGGMVLFGIYMLYNTQQIIHAAENHPTNSTELYDPIYHSIGIYMNTLSIFLRIVEILAEFSGSKRGGGGRRR